MWERSAEPAHNRFAQLRAEWHADIISLRQAYDARLQAAYEHHEAQKVLYLEETKSTRQSMQAAHQQLTHCQQHFIQAMDARSQAEARACEAEARAEALTTSAEALQTSLQQAEGRARKAEAKVVNLEADAAVYAAAMARRTTKTLTMAISTMVRSGTRG